MSFAERFGYAMRRSGHSITSFKRKVREAKVAGFSYPTIRRYLDGDNEPTLDFVRVAATILDIPAAWLAFGDPEPSPTCPACKIREARVREAVSLLNNHNA